MFESDYSFSLIGFGQIVPQVGPMYNKVFCLALILQNGCWNLAKLFLMSILQCRANFKDFIQIKWAVVIGKLENYCTYALVKYNSSIPPRLWNTGLVSSGTSLPSWEERASLALVGHPSSDGVVIKMSYVVDVLHRPALHPIFSYWVC